MQLVQNNRNRIHLLEIRAGGKMKSSNGKKEEKGVLDGKIEIGWWSWYKRPKKSQKNDIWNEPGNY